MPRPKGGVMVDGQHVGDTMQCVHCSAHWVHRPGSGRKRGWCLSCKGPVCGQAPCMGACIPLEMRLQGMETGKNRVQILHDLDNEGKTIILGS